MNDPSNKTKSQPAGDNGQNTAGKDGTTGEVKQRRSLQNKNRGIQNKNLLQNVLSSANYHFPKHILYLHLKNFKMLLLLAEVFL